MDGLGSLTWTIQNPSRGFLCFPSHRPQPSRGRCHCRTLRPPLTPCLVPVVASSVRRRLPISCRPPHPPAGGSSSYAGRRMLGCQLGAFWIGSAASYLLPSWLTPIVIMSTSQATGQVQLHEGVDDQTTNRRSKKRSRACEFFGELPEEGKAICIYCQKNCHIIKELVSISHS